MSIATRLLAVSIADSIFCRNIHVTAFHRVFKTVFMTAVTPFRSILFKNLRKSATVPEALFSAYLDLLDETASPQIHLEFNRSVMEPFLSSRHAPNDSSSFCGPATVGDSSRFAAAARPESCPLERNHRDARKFECRTAKSRCREMRRWKKVGNAKFHAANQEEAFILRLFSFNILAQNLLEAYPHLYRHHDKRALPWKHRRTLLLHEILQAQADVMCLQEVQEEHLTELVRPLEERGYSYLYKKRTNDKMDGLLLLYRSNVFDLMDSAKVEFFKPDVELLSRDNVALIVRLALKNNPETQVVIATTHLLYNPRRNDVRLGQTQLLLAELERIAFIENETNSDAAKYHPVILTGDFNLEPNSGVYNFITKGSFEYAGKGRNLEPTDQLQRRLSNMLIPPRLLITDNCQHFHVLAKRLRRKQRHQSTIGDSAKSKRNHSRSRQEKKEARMEVDPNSTDFQEVQIIEGHSVKFSSGVLTHPFNIRSIYSHKNRHGEREVTTYQDRWITVDYIFYSDIEPYEQYALPTQKKGATALPSMPNLVMGSDHVSLGASFKLKKKR